jgi:transcriptional regulator with XRE-family HTH domain
MTTRVEALPACLGRRLGLMRGKAELTQRQLARAIGVSASFITQVECGRRTPRLDVLARWTRRCGITISSVFEGVEKDLTAFPEGQ